MSSVFVDAHSVIDYFTGQLEKPVENYAGYMSTKALDEFSAQLVNYRTKHSLNQTELARELGITQPMVSQYESGTNNITVKRLCELCEKIGVRIRIDYESANVPVSKESYKPYHYDQDAKCSVSSEQNASIALSYFYPYKNATQFQSDPQHPISEHEHLNLPESA